MTPNVDAWHRSFFTDLYIDGDPESCDPARTRLMLDALRALLSRPGIHRVLDVACGIGRHAVPLSEAGFSVTGVDLSEPYLRRARQAASAAGQDIRFVAGDMRELASVAPTGMDAVISMHTSFGFFHAAADNARVLQQMRAVLRSGGLLIIDVTNRDAFLAQRPAPDEGGAFVVRAVERAAGVTYRHEERFDARTSRIRWTITDGRRPDALVTADYRVYSAHELIDMIEAAGFVVIDVFGDYDLQSFDVRSPRLLCVAGAA